MITLKQILTDIYHIEFKNLNILESGACSLSNLVTAEFLDSNNCWFLEPNPVDHKQLIKDGVKQCLQYALSDRNGTAEFTLTSHPGNSSLEHSKTHIEELKGYNNSFSKIEVITIRYETLQKITGCVFDLMSLDIEGHESIVLKSLLSIDACNLPKILVIECGYDWEDRLQLLRQLGYSIDTYYYNNCILSRDNTGISKNKNAITYYHGVFKKFVYFGKEIYSL